MERFFIAYHAQIGSFSFIGHAASFHSSRERHPSTRLPPVLPVSILQQWKKDNVHMLFLRQKIPVGEYEPVRRPA